jgi:hypothetical protein
MNPLTPSRPRAPFDLGIVAQTSKSAVSQVAKPAAWATTCDLPIWKSAIQQVGKPALRIAAALLVAVFSADGATANFDARGGQFIGLTNLKDFTSAPGTNASEVVLTSREFTPRISWNELIVSWNADMPKDSYLRVEARAVSPDRATKYFIMSLWSSNPAKYPRECVKRQKDADGDVETDTLVLQQLAPRFQIRLTLGGDTKQLPKIRFLGFHVLDNTAKPTPLPPNRAAWGRTLPVLERSQMAYEGGDVWCSPTTISMMLDFWSQKLHRPDLARDVPEIVKGVYDRAWGGTGNWVLNTAYAGSFPGMRAYTTRMSDVAELEDWVAHGMPVGLSLCYNRLRGKSRDPSGHLVVCVGFTKDGDPVINDPGTSKNVRKVFPRANLVDAWTYSKNAAYIILLENATPPKDRFGHWDSKISRQRTKTAK